MSASQFDPAQPLQDVDLVGEGCDSLAVGARGDYVILTFPVPVSWVALAPDTAKQVGECIARSGYAVESRDNVYGKTPIIIEQIRKRLVIAVAHLLKSDAERAANLDLTAQRCVELMLTEVQ